MIGIFDSGVGGLSVFREIKKLLPEEKYVYYSDNAYCPYGEKTKEHIIEQNQGKPNISKQKKKVPTWLKALLIIG